MGQRAGVWLNHLTVLPDFKGKHKDLTQARFTSVIFASVFMANIPTTEERLGRSPQHLVRYFVLFMSLVYTGMGAWLAWTAGQPTSPAMTHFAEIGLTDTRLRLLGLFFILYGLIRFTRSYRTHFRNITDPEEDDISAS